MGERVWREGSLFAVSVVASFSPSHHHSSAQPHPHTCFAAPVPPYARPHAWRGHRRVPRRAGAPSPCRPARPRPARPPPTGRGRARRKVGGDGVWRWGVSLCALLRALCPPMGRSHPRPGARHACFVSTSPPPPPTHTTQALSRRCASSPCSCTRRIKPPRRAAARPRTTRGQRCEGEGERKRKVIDNQHKTS